MTTYRLEPGVEGPPPRTSSPKTTLKQDLSQALEFVQFALKMSSRIRGLPARTRFVIGLILWKPILPKNR